MTTVTSSNLSPVDPALQQATAVLQAASRHLGPSLTAAWLYGSAVHGGLRPHSDLDLMLMVAQPMTAAASSALTADLLRLSGAPGRDTTRPLELTIVAEPQIKPWRYPPQREYQFGEWLRPALEAGGPIEPEPDPDLAVLVTMVRQHSRTLAGPDARDLLDPVPRQDLLSAMRAALPELVENWDEDVRNVLLTLCRMLVTASTGDILPKDRAADWVLRHCPGPHGTMVSWARAAYLGTARPDWETVRDDIETAIATLTPLIEAKLGMAGRRRPR